MSSPTPQFRRRSHVGHNSGTMHWSSTSPPVADDSDAVPSQPSAAIEALEALENISNSEINIRDVRLRHHVIRIRNGAKGEFLRVLFNATDSIGFRTFIMVIVIVQSIFLCIDTFTDLKYQLGWYLEMLDAIFLGIYLSEAVVKITVWQKFYFLDKWNWLDFLVILMGFILLAVEKLLEARATNGAGFQSMRVLRVVRIFRAMKALRILKAIHFLRKLQVILKTIFLSLKPLVAIVILITVIIYIFAVIGRGMFPEVTEFSSLGKAIFFLFGILTMDDWYLFYLRFTQESHQVNDLSILTFLVIYFLLNWLIMINLFVAVLVDNFTIALHKEEKEIGPIEEDDEDDWIDIEDDDDLEIGEEKKVTFESYYSAKDPNYPPIVRNCLKEYYKTVVTISNCLYTLKSNSRILDTMTEYTGQES